MDEKFISIRQVAFRIGAAPATVRRWVHNGRLPGYMAGGRIVVKEGDLLEFIRPVKKIKPVAEG